MKTALALLLGFSLAAGAYAGPMRHGSSEMEAEITAILDRNPSMQLGTMTMGDLEKLMGEISIIEQKAAYVQHARMASFMLPGLGQFIGADAAGGALFLAGDVAVLAGAVLGSYFLLPANVQYGSGAGTDASGLDYLNTSHENARNAWKSNSLQAYLPSMGVMAAGMLLRGALGWWSSGNAAELAKRNIADGKVTFQPELLPFLGSAGGPLGGMGMMMKWRY